MNEAEKQYKSKQTVTVKTTIPLLVWETWNKDCEANFGGTRYLKMMFDHEFRTSFNSIAKNVITDLELLRDDVSTIKADLNALGDKPTEKGIKTMGSSSK